MVDRKYLGMIPLSRVVKASIIDSYGDINRQEQTHTHWAARGLRKLYNESLPSIENRVLIPVNKNTNTAPLPCDFKQENFVGTIIGNRKVPISLDINLVNTCNIVKNVEKECPRCKQDKKICESLEITESKTTVTIEGDDYDKTVTKKLYPNGDYYLETSTPVKDIEGDTVVYVTKKEFIVNFEMKPCGCLAQTDLNTSIVQRYCPDTYNRYYACGCDVIKPTYKIFEEEGLIQLAGFSGDEIYLEYEGFMAKIGGRYMVPQVAFETLVEWTKYKSVQGKTNMTRYDKEGYHLSYLAEKRNMEKILGQVSLQFIVESLKQLPNFEFDTNVGYDRLPLTNG